MSALLALQRTAGNAAVTAALETQRHVHHAGCGHGTAVQRSAVHDVLRSSGRPLGSGLRDEMEQRLGADFGDVRIHDDAVAQRSAAEIGARAYTSGSHVVVGAGGADKHTLAHELTHVIQQRSGPVAGTDNGQGLSVSDPGDRFEREAEANAKRAMSVPLAGADTGGGAPRTALALQRLAGNTAMGEALRGPGREPENGRHQLDEGRAHHGGQARDPVVQRAPGEYLSSRVLRRLHIANDAIRDIQADTRHAANQQAALIHTLYNASLRAVVQQHNGFWDFSRLTSRPDARDLSAAKALHARSMICESSAQCTFSLLRRYARGETIRMVMSPQQSHWFVIIGGVNEDPSEWVVADPWPTQARAVEWTDHFCYTPDLETVFIDRTMQADGNDEARHLSHLISLNDAGWYALHWDLSRLRGRPLTQIGEMFQAAGIGINLHQPDLVEQLMQGLAMADSWSTDDIGTWPNAALEVWCLAQIDAQVVRRLFADTASSGNTRDLRAQVAAGVGEVRQQGDSSWIWDIPHAYGPGGNR
ncbi:DUF4157 domain-containing protein [Actinomadura graeca]|uniref:eCIS core domain-containing protein n=1 Tax=Actinomadura graeca TaxID=2750812 RepID=UPI001E472FA5|nr:DUF4157 domain-containing protein [Actinomadura graeca]